MSLDRIRVVLVRPQGAANVGAVARALKNMGLGRLVLVAPPGLDVVAAERMAVHADDVLAARVETATLADAVADCGMVVGTAGRAFAAPHVVAGPRALAPEIVAASAANDVALVFGPEDHGLSNEELGLCQRVLSIPASLAYPSLNLAQAVMVCVYEIFVADAATPAAAARATALTSADAAAEAARSAASPRELAASAEVERMYAALERALRAIGYLHETNAAHMMATFRRLLGRAGLDDLEVRALLGLARQIEWAARTRRAP